jgi:hypothetical protein
MAVFREGEITKPEANTLQSLERAIGKKFILVIKFPLERLLRCLILKTMDVSCKEFIHYYNY